MLVAMITTGYRLFLVKKYFSAGFQICSRISTAHSAVQGRKFHSRGQLSSEDVECFHINGVVCLRGVFKPEWILKVKKGIEKNIKKRSKFSQFLPSESSVNPQGYYFNDYCNWRTVGEFEDYVVNSPAAEIAGKLMKSKFSVFYHEHIFRMEAAVFREVPWHQDQSYYPIDGNQNCSIWMPVTPVSKDTCIKFVEGSHRTGWYYPRKFETSKTYERMSTWEDHHYKATPDISAKPEMYNLLSWDLELGDCIAFHMQTIHGAPKNTSVHTREVIATRWLGEDCRVVERPWVTSPPTTGGLKPGDPPHLSPEFPTLWNAEQ